MQLTLSQEEAVAAQNVVVTAGPGSGKTRVLVERVRRLIETGGAAPRDILAITFTIKAAREMHSRLVEAKDISLDLRKKFESAQIQTIDGFSTTLLRENALTAGIDPEFQVLEPADSERLLQEEIEAALNDAFENGPRETEAFLRAFSGSDERAGNIEPTMVHRRLSALIDRIRSHGVEPFVEEIHPKLSPEDFADDLRRLGELRSRNDLVEAAEALEKAGPADHEAQIRALRGIDPGDGRAMAAPQQDRKQARALVKRIREMWLPEFASQLAAQKHEPSRQWLLEVTRRILDGFERRKQALGVVDFGDLQRLATRLLQGEAAPALRYRHILIDEFQDTNPLQAKLIEAVIAAHGNRPPVQFVVGDINQSIYGFRHADPAVFREHRKQVRESGGKVVELHENFRSRGEILEAVHRLLADGSCPGVERHSLRAAGRHPAKTEPSIDVHIVSQAAQAGEDAVEREAGWCAARLTELIEESGGALQWGDCAILLRTRESAARFAAELRRRRVPFRLESGKNFYRLPEVVEAAAFLRMLRNPRDEIALAAVLKSAFAGIEDRTLLALKASDKNLSYALVSEAVEGPDGELLREFHERLERYRADRDTVPPDRLLAAAAAECGYDNWLAATERGGHALANFEKLLRIVRELAADGKSFDAVSAALDERINAAPVESEADEPTDSQNALQLLTMHAAKGLEFPVVAVAGLQYNRPSSADPLTFSPEHGIGVKWRNPIRDGEPIGDPMHRKIDEEIKQQESDEANRLLYVAATRAEQHLILSCSFSKKPEKRGFCKLLFQSFEIDHKHVSKQRRKITDRLPEFFLLQTDEPAPEADESGYPAAAPPPPEPLLLRPREPESSADSATSVSAVAVFAQCPRKYFLSHSIGLDSTAGPAVFQTDAEQEEAPDERERGGGKEFGLAVHAWLAGETSADGVPEAVRETGENFQKHPLGLRAARAERKSYEQSLLFALDDRILQGQIDLLFEEDGRRILVDYKTDRVDGRELEARARSYEPQIRLYAAALAAAGRPVDEAFLFFLREAEACAVDIGADALAGARDLAARLFEAQRRREFPLRVGGHCRQCPHYRSKACPAVLPGAAAAQKEPQPEATGLDLF